MKALAAKYPDSEFFMMEDVEDDHLRSAIEELEDLAHEQLASSINETVEIMVRAVLKMQQEHCEKSVQDEVEDEEGKPRSHALVKFIQDINAQPPIGRRDS